METDRMLMAHGWKFCLTEDTTAVMPEYDDSGWRWVTIPHDWQIQQKRTKEAPGGQAQGFFPREQVGIYRLHFQAKEEWRGKCVRFLFDGVQRFSEVWLNGIKIGGHAYGYVPFVCDATNALHFGKDNVLAVRADNRSVEGEYAASGDRWYSGAGIIRDVWLLTDEATHLTHDGLRITAEPVFGGPRGDVPDVKGIRCAEAVCRAVCEVSGGCAGRTVQLTVTGPDGQVVFSEERTAEPQMQWDFTIPQPQLWSPETPVLYRARAELDGDELESGFGVRSAMFDCEDGFLLNGVKTKLWGVNVHHDGGAFGAAVPPEIWERRLRSLKRMGVNTIRCAHHPMPEYFYTLLDEMGFLCIDELTDKWEGCGMYFDRTWADRMEDLAAMIRRDANHPCVILWSVGNEISHQFSEAFFANLKEMSEAARRLDPGRAVTCVLISCVLKDYNDLTPMGKKMAVLKRYAALVDVFCGNYMEHYYEKMRECGIRLPVIGSEVRMLYRNDEGTLNSAQVSRESPYAIVRKYDWVCGAVIWAGVDYLGESTMWPQRGWTGNPLDSTGDWKLRAWYQAAQFKKEPILKICVYDESEPWDGARGLWGFPQMRSHWKYPHFEKVMHVAVFTNCEKVVLIQNSQTPRIAYLKDFPDGIVHFHLPYIPGVLRAEGYIGEDRPGGGLLAAEDTLYSDHEAAELTVTANREIMPADGKSTAMIDVELKDAHGRRYMLEERKVKVREEGAPVTVLMDNGNAWDTESFERRECPTHDGHLTIFVQSGEQAGNVRLRISTEGFGEQEITIELTRNEE